VVAATATPTELAPTEIVLAVAVFLFASMSAPLDCGFGPVLIATAVPSPSEAAVPEADAAPVAKTPTEGLAPIEAGTAVSPAFVNTVADGVVVDVICINGVVTATGAVAGVEGPTVVEATAVVDGTMAVTAPKALPGL